MLLGFDRLKMPPLAHAGFGLFGPFLRIRFSLKCGRFGGEPFESDLRSVPSRAICISSRFDCRHVIPVSRVRRVYNELQKIATADRRTDGQSYISSRN